MTATDFLFVFDLICIVFDLVYIVFVYVLLFDTHMLLQYHITRLT